MDPLKSQKSKTSYNIVFWKWMEKLTVVHWHMDYYTDSESRWSTKPGKHWQEVTHTSLSGRRWWERAKTEILYYFNFLTFLEKENDRDSKKSSCHGLGLENMGFGSIKVLSMFPWWLCCVKLDICAHHRWRKKKKKTRSNHTVPCG